MFVCRSEQAPQCCNVSAVQHHVCDNVVRRRHRQALGSKDRRVHQKPCGSRQRRKRWRRMAHTCLAHQTRLCRRQSQRDRRDQTPRPRLWRRNQMTSAQSSVDNFETRFWCYFKCEFNRCFRRWLRVSVAAECFASQHSYSRWLSIMFPKFSVPKNNRDGPKLPDLILVCIRGCVSISDFRSVVSWYFVSVQYKMVVPAVDRLPQFLTHLWFHFTVRLSLEEYWEHFENFSVEWSFGRYF